MKTGVSFLADVIFIRDAGSRDTPLPTLAEFIEFCELAYPDVVVSWRIDQDRQATLIFEKK